MAKPLVVESLSAFWLLVHLGCTSPPSESDEETIPTASDSTARIRAPAPMARESGHQIPISFISVNGAPALVRLQVLSGRVMERDGSPVEPTTAPNSLCQFSTAFYASWGGFNERIPS